MPKVLIVDDEPLTCSLFTDALKSDGYRVATAGDAQEALDHVRSDLPDIVILDLRLPGVDGIETLRKLKEVAPPLPVIILTGYGDIASAVETMRLGAYDYLTKPVQLEEILTIVRRALEGREPVGQIEDLRDRLRRRGKLPWLLGGSREIQEVIEQVRQVAASTFTVLIQGETGTGKELVARSIHERSARRDNPFVALDCGAIPDTLIESELFGYEKGAFTGADRRKEGHFQLAAGGTLFLDEIVNLPLTTQAKLLRTLQERQIQVLGGKGPLSVDVRIIAASNVPLERETRAGRFRQDLYYRLTEFIIVVPPLRERREDIVYLAKRFVAEAAMELRRQVRGISDEALRALIEYPWPGNVRELRNVVRRAVLVTSDLIRPEHLLLQPADSLRAPAIGDLASWPMGSSLREMTARAAADVERRAIEQALHAARGNKSEAARILKTDFKTLHLKMKRYGLDARQFFSP